jgi:hypothetical protein
MTTGRINQVTIFLAARDGGADPVVVERQAPGHKSRARRNTKEGARPKSIARPSVRPLRRRRSCRIGHPIAPTEFPKVVVRRRGRSVPDGDNPDTVTWTPREEDTGNRSHRDELDGYRPRLASRNLK